MSQVPAAFPPLNDETLNVLFREARTFYKFADREVADELLKRIYDVARMGPTSNNSSPMRVVFVKSPEGKARLMPGIKPKNVDKVISAPVTAVFGFDLRFYDHFSKLAPHAVESAENYIKDPDLKLRAAFRNGTLQAAYFLILARGFGLQCGPMSGFLHDVVDETFFAGTEIKSNFLMNIGYGLPESVRPRGYRFSFEEACEIV